MKKLLFISRIIILFFVVSGCRTGKDIITINDSAGVLGDTNAPVSVELELSGSKSEAAGENRLALREITGNNDNKSLIPVQVVGSENDTGLQKLVFIMPHGEKGLRKFKLVEGNNSKSGLMILQSKYNPEYPGTWIEYPQLSWVQPTFPTPGTRYPLSKQEPLVLRYRLIVHKGGRPDTELSRKRWDAYNSDLTPLCNEE